MRSSIAFSHLSRGLFVGAAAAAATCLPATSAQAQTLFFDNFDQEPSIVLNNNNLANFTVVEGTVDTYSPYAGQGFGVSVDLDGSSQNAGRIETKTLFDLAAGDYTFSFALGKNGGATETMLVGVGNFFREQISDALAYPTPVTRTFTFTLAAPTTGRIFFDHAGGDNAGYVIDNVSLVRNVTAAPEPGTLALLAAGMLPVAGAVLRRRKA